MQAGICYPPQALLYENYLGCVHGIAYGYPKNICLKRGDLCACAVFVWHVRHTHWHTVC